MDEKPKLQIPHDAWTAGFSCEHDWQREGKHFLCSKCNRVEYEHMLECVDGRWRQKEIKVSPHRPRRRR